MIATPLTQMLIVEDSDEDFEMLKVAFESAGLKQPILHFKDGGELISYLDQKPLIFSVIILLDLNLPEMDGREVLEVLRKTARWKGLPVVVFSTSDDPKDVQFCYEHGISGYFVKPVDSEKLERIAKAFKDYWLDQMILPEPL